MKTIEVWPQEVQLGAAIAFGRPARYVEMVDPDSGTTVIAYFREEALPGLVAQMQADLGDKPAH